MYTLGKILVAGLSVIGLLTHPILEEKQETPIQVEAVSIVKKLSTEEKIELTFGKDYEIMLAIAKAESDKELHVNKKGYNCIYNKVSKPCKPEDREKAWSVDCGLFQINIKGTKCPAHLLEVDGNIKRAKEIYQSQGITAWSAYKNKSYLKYM